MNIGTIIQWGSDTLPNGWLLCDGSAISRTTYADLFAVIGTSFGEGDGSTTFNLPDLRGRVGVGKSSDTEFDTLGEIGGEKKHTLTIDEMPRHDHGIYNTNASGGDQTWTVSSAGSKGWGTNWKTTYTGGSQPHNILQPYTVVNYIIKALVEDTVKISELESATSIDGTEVLPIVQNGVTKKAETSKLMEGILGGEVYSTNEVKTNKVWIDGKPIYRKVISNTSASSTNADKVLYTNSDVDKIINAQFNYSKENITYPAQNQTSFIFYWDDNSHTLVERHTNDYWNTTTITFVLEYTKTTD